MNVGIERTAELTTLPSLCNDIASFHITLVEIWRQTYKPARQQSSTKHVLLQSVNQLHEADFLLECVLIRDGQAALPCWFPRSDIQSIVNYICTMWCVFRDVCFFLYFLYVFYGLCFPCVFYSFSFFFFVYLGTSFIINNNHFIRQSVYNTHVNNNTINTAGCQNRQESSRFLATFYS